MAKQRKHSNLSTTTDEPWAYLPSPKKRKEDVSSRKLNGLTPLAIEPKMEATPQGNQKPKKNHRDPDSDSGRHMVKTR